MIHKRRCVSEEGVLLLVGSAYLFCSTLGLWDVNTDVSTDGMTRSIFVV